MSWIQAPLSGRRALPPETAYPVAARVAPTAPAAEGSRRCGSVARGEVDPLASRAAGYASNEADRRASAMCGGPGRENKLSEGESQPLVGYFTKRRTPPAC